VTKEEAITRADAAFDKLVDILLAPQAARAKVA
jgi:hypothetical protein